MFALNVAAVVCVTIALAMPARAADTDLTGQVRIYAPINAIALPCELEAIDQSANSKMLEQVKSDPKALALLQDLHSETQAAYRKARDAGDKAGFCSRFLASNSQYVRARPAHY